MTIRKTLTQREKQYIEQYKSLLSDRENNALEMGRMESYAYSKVQSCPRFYNTLMRSKGLSKSQESAILASE